MKYRFLVFIFMIIASATIYATEDFYQFNQAADRERFQTLTSQLRCLVCQNQNLAESNAALATDLRNQIYQQVIAGKSDKQIVDYLVNRYGDFILYNPPLNLQTFGLWFGPFVFLFFGLGYLFFYLKKIRRDNI